MSILVTRPLDDALTTAKALHVLGYDCVVDPVMVFEKRDYILSDQKWSGVVLTSAYAVRVGLREDLLQYPVFAVGQHTAEAAQEAGFKTVVSCRGDAEGLPDLVLDFFKDVPSLPLLWPCGERLARDLEADFDNRGMKLVPLNVYCMIGVEQLGPFTVDAMSSGRIQAVLHYSARSAEIFLSLLEKEKLLSSLDRFFHFCLSHRIGDVLRSQGARHVFVAQLPQDSLLLALVDKTLSDQGLREKKCE